MSMLYTTTPARLAAAAAGIGDLHSHARGSGARFNVSKPDYSLIPLTVLAASYRKRVRYGDDAWPALAALCRLGRFQEHHSTAVWLHSALEALGDAGWVECAHVFEYGRGKYVAWNWAKGMPWSVPLACAVRHLVAMIGGEQTDPESGHPHRGHVFCNVVMLLTFMRSYTEGNDLPPLGMLTPELCANTPTTPLPDIATS